jgi:hypothetical protein
MTKSFADFFDLVRKTFAKQSLLGGFLSYFTYTLKNTFEN